MVRTSTYRTTVTDRNAQEIVLLRRQIRIMNAQQRVRELIEGEEKRRYRVTVRGRLGKNSPHRHLYAVGGKHYRRHSMDIRPEHAERFDVYVLDYWRH